MPKSPLLSAGKATKNTSCRLRDGWKARLDKPKGSDGWVGRRAGLEVWIPVREVVKDRGRNRSGFAVI